MHLRAHPHLVLALALAALWPSPSSAARRTAPINAILGDASWIAAHGAPPPASASEIDRIRTHLLYVEARLRAAPVGHLDHERRANRKRALDRLHAYTLEGGFPEHDPSAADAPHRRSPRFIDSSGRLCAVGDLVATTDGRAAVEAIQARHEYDRVLDMHEPALDRWAARHGFTLHELASIQPEYDERPSYSDERGITWGVRASAPILLSDVRTDDATALSLFALGGGAEAQLGWEYDGIALLLTGGSSAHDASARGVLLMTRTAASVRFTIDVGETWIAPQLGGSIGLLVASLDAASSATALASLQAGAQLRMISWLSLEVGVALEGAVPGAAFVDAIAWLSPYLGLSLFAPGS